MDSRRFFWLDVFTDRPFGGNPLAVFPDGHGLDADCMQTIARELNLSETVFVLPPSSPRAVRRARIFTPGRELPFAGHPTIGTAFLLAHLGIVPVEAGHAELVLEEGVGEVPVSLHADGGTWFVRLTAAVPPQFGPEPPDRALLAAVLGIPEAEIVPGADRPVIAGCGLPFTFVRVRDADTLAAMHFDRYLWSKHVASSPAPELFVFALLRDAPDGEVRARMFAPGVGVIEDPATGSAGVALAAVLASRFGGADGTLRWTVQQGVEMGRPSRLTIEADLHAGRVVATRVGGHAVVVADGNLRIPQAVTSPGRS